MKVAASAGLGFTMVHSVVDKVALEHFGLKAIAISHPHFYTTMVEWSHAFGKVPVLIDDDVVAAIPDDPAKIIEVPVATPLHSIVTTLSAPAVSDLTLEHAKELLAGVVTQVQADGRVVHDVSGPLGGRRRAL